MARAKLSSSFLAFGSNSNGAVSGASATKHVSIAATASTLDFDGASSADVALTGLSTASFSGHVTASSTPSQDGHLANKAYVDSVTQGLNAKNSVKLASTANVDGTWSTIGTTTLTLAAGTLDIDGVAVVNGNRVLLKHQNATYQNGIFTVSGVGSAVVLSRATDFDSTSPTNEIVGAYVLATSGTTNASIGFVVSAPTRNTSPFTLDDTGNGEIVFAQFSAAGQITPGDALTKSGNTLDVAVDDSTIEVNNDALRIKAGGVRDNQVHAAAAIQLSKLENVTSGRIIVGNASNVPTAVAMSGDVAIAANGATTIQADAVHGSMINSDAVDDSTIEQHTDSTFRIKAGGILNAHINASADIAYSKMQDVNQGSILVGNAGNKAVPLDAKTAGQLLIGNGTTITSVAMSGDVAIAANGATTIQADAVEGPMLNANCVDDASLEQHTNNKLRVKAGGITHLHPNKTMITGQTALGSASVAAADSFLFFDADADSLKKCTYQHLRDSIFANVSSDVTAAAGGAVTIGPGKVQGSMLNNNVISVQTELAHADIADADELMISDGGTLKKVGVDSLRDHFFGVVSGDATVSDGGSLQIGTGLTVSNSAGTLAFTDTGVTLSVSTSSTIDQNLSSGQAVQFADVSVSSDKKWKDNIKQCKGGLDMINRMRGVSWRWNDKVPQAGKQASGIIAQELAHVMPYALNKAEAGLKVNYNCLWGPAIEAIKELSAKVKELEQKLQQHQHNETFYK